ncbi:MAG TPA: hypothetical protein VLI69_00295 [Gammaproteobacteria bacterium]|nr:hypothetical protein [Gammaproteobacteria bacterium]
MNYKNILSCFLVTIGLLLTACASKDVAPGDYDSTEVGKIKKVIPGVIISKRPVRIHNQALENTSTVVEGASSATSESDNVINRSHGYEYVIRLNSGAIISLVQTEDLKLKTKQHILVIYGNNTRVVPDDGSEDY